MSDEIRNRKLALGITWIKAPSTGNTYLCPADFDASNASEEELRRVCIEESMNPQND